MTTKTALHELDNEAAYETELSECVGVTGFHHWFFLTALAEAVGCRFRAFTVDSGGERLGVVPLLIRRYGPVSTVNFTPMGSLGPVIRGEALRAGRMGELLKGTEPLLRRQRSVAARWSFSPGLRLSPQDLNLPRSGVFEWENFVVPADKSVDDIWKAMSTGRRQSVRQTEKKGVSVAESAPEDIADWFPEQMTALYERETDGPDYTLPVVRRLTRRLAGHPRMLWRSAKGEDGTLYGMTASVVGEDRLWGWQIVGSPVRSMSPHTLLHWDSIKWSRERELAYDMGGVPSDGIRVVKRSLGAEAEQAMGLYRFRPNAAYQAAMALREWGPVERNWMKLRHLIGN